MKLLSFSLIVLLMISVVAVAGEKKAEMKVDGMTCNGCVSKVKSSLEKVDGVKSVEVSLENSMAVVVFDDTKTNESTLKNAVNQSGYKAADVKAADGKKAGCCPAASAGCCGDSKAK